MHHIHIACIYLFPAIVTNLKQPLIEQWRDRHVKSKIECKICKNSFAFFTNFQDHIQNEHKGKKNKPISYFQQGKAIILFIDVFVQM
jgi:hypothetical protein